MKKTGFVALALSAVMALSPLTAFAGEADLVGNYYSPLTQAGIIASNADSVVKVGTENDKVKIKAVDTLAEDVIIVTLDSYMPEFDVNDLSLKAYNSEWYGLSPKLKDRITVKDSIVTVNSDGCTVIIYKIEQKLNGSRLENDYGTTTVSNEANEIKIADNYLSWQMDHGGWDKGVDLHKSRAWNGKEKKNVSSGWTAADGVTPLGTIDNDATYTHMRQIALAYKLTGDAKYKESFEKGLGFLENLQYPSGGFAQVYPRRGWYSDNVTYNDDAMINVLIMYEDIIEKNHPFDTDLVSDETCVKLEKAIDKAVDYTLKAQIVSKGVKSAWCAQHDPETYEPVPARAYEPKSISGSESIGVIKFLMHRPQTPEIKEAVDAALAWFDKVKVENTAYNARATDGKYFYEKQGSTIWYRFYEIDTELGLFGDIDGSIHYDISKISAERRTGYTWANNWPEKLLTTYSNYGYYPNRIEVSVKNTTSKDINGKTLASGDSMAAAEVNLAEVLTPEEAPAYIPGDVNGDDKLDASDAAEAMQKVLVGTFETGAESKGLDILAVADVDKDGSLSAADAATIMQKVLNSSFVMAAE